MADVITIDGLEVRCLIGIHAWERAVPQLLSVKLLVEVDGAIAARSGLLEDTLDYSLVSALVRFVLVAGRFLLLETAAEVIAATVLGAATGMRPLAVTVELTKPAALPGATMVRYTARRAAERVPWEERVYGRSCRLFDAPTCQLISLEISPQKSVRLSQDFGLAFALLALSPGIASLPTGSAYFMRGHLVEDHWLNITTLPCSLLLVAPRSDVASRSVAHEDAVVDFFAQAGHYKVKAGS